MNSDASNGLSSAEIVINQTCIQVVTFTQAEIKQELINIFAPIPTQDNHLKNTDMFGLEDKIVSPPPPHAALSTGGEYTVPAGAEQSKIVSRTNVENIGSLMTVAKEMRASEGEGGG